MVISDARAGGNDDEQKMVWNGHGKSEGEVGMESKHTRHWGWGVFACRCVPWNENGSSGNQQETAAEHKHKHKQKHAAPLPNRLSTLQRTRAVEAMKEEVDQRGASDLSVRRGEAGWSSLFGRWSAEHIVLDCSRTLIPAAADINGWGFL